MKKHLFSVAASGYERLLLASDGATAHAWCQANDERIAEADAVVVTRRTDLVDLAAEGGKEARTAPAVRRSPRAERIPPPMPKKRAKAAKRGREADVPEGMVLVSTLAKEAGITAEGMRYRLNRAGVVVKRMPGRGGPSACNEAMGRAAMHSEPKPKKERIAAKPEKREPRSGDAKPKAEELGILAKTATSGPTEPASPSPDKFMRIEQVAKALRMDEGEVAAIKRQGNVGGGFGWVNFSQLARYMASPEYRRSTED